MSCPMGPAMKSHGVGPAMNCVDAYRVVMMPIVESCDDAYSGEL